MKKFVLSLYFLLAFQFLGAVELYKTSMEDLPEIGAETSVYLGDEMIFQRSGQYKNCIKMNSDIRIQNKRYLHQIPKGEFLCKAKSEDKVYKAQVITAFAQKFDGIDHAGKYYFKSKGDKSSKLCTDAWRGECTEDFSKEEAENIFTQKPKFFISPNSMQHSIEYVGRSGSVLKFLYTEKEYFVDIRWNYDRTEIINNSGYLAREAFNREFQVDLNEGNVGAFKGAVFEILEATNASIKYKVIRHFP